MSERLLICGGRDFGHTIEERADAFFFLDRLNARYKISVVIEGGAIGADAVGRSWAKERLIECISHFAAWDIYGHQVEPIHNQQLLDQTKPTLVVVFPGGSGTQDMLQRSAQAGLPIFELSLPIE
ncbi:MAG: DUF2493 domain-containing protein [Methylocystaceae bacterium]|nr:DUF2493 domain-containing protein [Methylocystaceae bacterium]